MAHVQSMGALPTLARAPLRRRAAEALALVREWRRRARGRRELAALSDRCLHDIGLTRYDAQREARKPFWRA
jgi:uncharacterized protein YjiS (DUF1127 family)